MNATPVGGHSRATAAGRANDGQFDLAVIGAGIIGLSTALAAARRRLRVVVVDRDAQANGASVRNFGLVVVSGQHPTVMWQRARRSRDLWLEVAAAAGIRIEQNGLWIIVRRTEAVAVLEAFLATEMAQGCSVLAAPQARLRAPQCLAPEVEAVLESRTEIRVEPRDAIPKFASWLAGSLGVTFLRNTAVRGIDLPRLDTSRGPLHAQRVAVCAGDDFTGLYAERIGAYAPVRCQLQMLRLENPGFRLPASLMSDLGLLRYPGFADLSPAPLLRERLAREQPAQLRHGVHLIVVQSADGSLVVGDSHEYAPTPQPYARAEIDRLILDEFRLALGFSAPAVIERWVGTYASAADHSVILDTPCSGVRIAIVTSGTGASTGPAIGEEVVAALFDGSRP